MGERESLLVAIGLWLLTPYYSPLTPCSLLLTPYSLLLTPNSLLLTPYSLLLTPHPNSLLLAPCSLLLLHAHAAYYGRRAYLADRREALLVEEGIVAVVDEHLRGARACTW